MLEHQVTLFLCCYLKFISFIVYMVYYENSLSIYAAFCIVQFFNFYCKPYLNLPTAILKGAALINHLELFYHLTSV